MERSGSGWTQREVARLLVLLESERRFYQEILAALPFPVALLNTERNVVASNRAFRSRFHVGKDELSGRRIDDVVASAALVDHVRDSFARGSAASGHSEWIEIHGLSYQMILAPMPHAEPEVDGPCVLLVLFESEASGSRQTHPQPARERPAVPASPAAQAPAVALAGMPAILWQASENLTFTYVGGSAEAISGYSSSHWLRTPGFFNSRIQQADREATLAAYRAAIARRSEASAEFRLAANQGKTVWVRETISVTEDGSISGVLTRLDQRKRIERQQMTAARSEALQGLAARLAHDLNNPLMIITGYAEEMLGGIPADDPHRTDAEQILSATERITDITGQLLEMTRKQAQPPEVIDLSAFLHNMERALTRASGVTVEIAAPAPVRASANAAQLEQVLLALATPAREDARDRTRLRVSCGTTVVSEQTGSGPAAGTYAQIALHDDAKGFDPERSIAVFEAVLTKGPVEAGKTPSRKEQLASAGAAIARAYQIVREWGGDVFYAGEKSRGTTFAIFLPLAEPVLETPPVSTTRKNTKRSEVPLTVLVVDDEEDIRSLVAKILRREKYNVLEASSITEGLDVASSHGGPIELLVTDVMLGDGSGRDLAEQLREAFPAIKILYISGYTEDESVRTGSRPPGAKFLQKPFTLGSLVGKVREALNS